MGNVMQIGNVTISIFFPAIAADEAIMVFVFAVWSNITWSLVEIAWAPAVAFDFISYVFRIRYVWVT